MPAKTRKIPSYRLHKPTGQAIVRLAGRMHYLGTHGSDSSRQKYDQLIAEWLTVGLGETTTTHNWTVTQLAVAFVQHCQVYYVKGGKPTDEVACVRSGINTQKFAQAFGSLLTDGTLKEVQITKGNNREYAGFTFA